jgi:hypothetical protein
MLIRTGRGSISLVAGCCWVNSVRQPKPGGRPDNSNDQLAPPKLISKIAGDRVMNVVDPGDSQHRAP